MRGGGGGINMSDGEECDNGDLMGGGVWKKSGVLDGEW